MRYWFDIVTPKQILFFQPVIEGLRKEKHEVLVTSRRFREVEQLASLVGLELIFFGVRGGKEPLEQFELSLERMRQLLPEIVKFSPQLSVSVASADCARISFGLRVRHVAVNDSPHSSVAGKLSLPLSYRLLTPWIIPYSAWSGFGVSRPQISRYKALDPAAWLKRRSPLPAAKDRRDRATIVVRLEESYSPYLAGSDETWSESVLARIARDFKGYRLVALCRYDDQLARTREKFGATYEIPEKVIDGAQFVAQSDVFVGMGGTMTTEAALLGVPAISAFQGPALYTERYLLSKRLLLKAKTVDDVPKFVKRSLDPSYAKRYRARAKALLDWMEDPAAAVINYLKAVPAPGN